MKASEKDLRALVGFRVEVWDEPNGFTAGILREAHNIYSVREQVSRHTTKEVVFEGHEVEAIKDYGIYLE